MATLLNLEPSSRLCWTLKCLTSFASSWAASVSQDLSISPFDSHRSFERARSGRAASVLQLAMRRGVEHQGVVRTLWIVSRENSSTIDCAAWRALAPLQLLECSSPSLPNSACGSLSAWPSNPETRHLNGGATVLYEQH